MKVKRYCMFFYEDLALLHTVANKQTLFLAALFSRMDKNNIVQLTVHERKSIMKEIDSNGKNVLLNARQYLSVLSDGGLIKNIGDGAYMVNPKIVGLSALKGSIDYKTKKYINIKYDSNGKRTITVDAETGELASSTA